MTRWKIATPPDDETEENFSYEKNNFFLPKLVSRGLSSKAPCVRNVYYRKQLICKP